MIYYRLWLIFLGPKTDTLFLLFSEDFQIRVSDSSRLIVNGNGISFYENLSLDVDNQKEIN